MITVYSLHGHCALPIGQLRCRNDLLGKYPYAGSPVYCVPHAKFVKPSAFQGDPYMYKKFAVQAGEYQHWCRAAEMVQPHCSLLTHPPPLQVHLFLRAAWALDLVLGRIRGDGTQPYDGLLMILQLNCPCARASAESQAHQSMTATGALTLLRTTS